MEHPFVRNAFIVSSPTEIAIIRKYRLTNLQYDPDRSHADIIATLMDPATLVPAVEPEEETAQDIEADERSMLKEKAVLIKQVMAHRKSIEAAAREYTKTTSDTSVLMAMAGAGRTCPHCIANTATARDLPPGSRRRGSSPTSRDALRREDGYRPPWAPACR